MTHPNFKLKSFGDFPLFLFLSSLLSAYTAEIFLLLLFFFLLDCNSLVEGVNVSFSLPRHHFHFILCQQPSFLCNQCGGNDNRQPTAYARNLFHQRIVLHAQLAEVSDSCFFHQSFNSHTPNFNSRPGSILVFRSFPLPKSSYVSGIWRRRDDPVVWAHFTSSEAQKSSKPLKTWIEKKPGS